MRATTLDRAGITRTIPAWLWRNPASQPPAAPVVGGAPQLRLQVVQDDGESLAVQVAQGEACSRGSRLYLEDRGLFEVAAVLRRQDIGGTAVYLRLRSRPDRAAAARVSERPRPSRSAATRRTS